MSYNTYDIKLPGEHIYYYIKKYKYYVYYFNMDEYKIKYLINELNKNNIKIMLINKSNEQEYYIVLPYNNNYIVIQNINSAHNYNPDIENKELLQICSEIRYDTQRKRPYNNYDKIIINIQNIYIIRLNLNGYITKKKKRYPSIFTINNDSDVDVNIKEWIWRFDLLKVVINNITNRIDNDITFFSDKKNYIIKLFYRHFSVNDIFNYNII